MGANPGEQLLLDGLRLGERSAGEHGLLVQDLPAHDLVDPCLVDVERAQFVGDRDRIAAGPEKSRRSLQHRYMAALGRDRRDQCRRRRARTDDDDRLPGVVDILRPILRVNDPPFEVLHSGPFGRITLGMTVVALAHPQKIGSDPHRLAGIGPHTFEGPELVAARPAGRGDCVPIADMAVETVLGDDFAHVVEDLGSGRDRRARPRFEAITKGVEVAVGARTRVAVREPRAPEAFLRLEHDKARAGALLGEMIGTTDPGDAGPDDHDVEVLGLLRCGFGEYCHLGHRVPSRFVVEFVDALSGRAWLG